LKKKTGVLFTECTPEDAINETQCIYILCVHPSCYSSSFCTKKKTKDRDSGYSIFRVKMGMMGQHYLDTGFIKKTLFDLHSIEKYTNVEL
jgi:hypothetical protein